MSEMPLVPGDGASNLDHGRKICPRRVKPGRPRVSGVQPPESRMVRPKQRRRQVESTNSSKSGFQHVLFLSA